MTSTPAAKRRALKGVRVLSSTTTMAEAAIKAAALSLMVTARCMGLTMIQNNILDEIVSERLERCNLELYAAWRAGYDYLYINSRISPETFKMEMSFVPSNNPRHMFRGFRTERYDLRDEHLDDEVRQRLYEYSFNDD